MTEPLGVCMTTADKAKAQKRADRRNKGARHVRWGILQRPDERWEVVAWKK